MPARSLGHRRVAGLSLETQETPRKGTPHHHHEGGYALWPRRWFRLYLGQPGWAPGVGWSRPGETLSWPLGPLRGTCHATPRDLRRALGPAPCGAHPRPAVTERQSRRGTSAVRGSPSPTRGSPLPCLSATQPHPDIPTIRLPWSSPLVSLSSRPARADPRSGPLGPLAPARWDAGTSRSGTSQGPRQALALLLEPSAGAAGRLRALCARVLHFQLSRFLRVAFFFPFLDYW